MRSHEVSVMQFGGPHGLVAEELLYGADVGSVRKQRDREGVAEPVRVRVDARQLANTVNRPAQASRDSGRLAVTRPKEVRGIAAVRREGLEIIDCILVQQYLQRDPVLLGAQHEVPGLLQLARRR